MTTPNPKENCTHQWYQPGGSSPAAQPVICAICKKSKENSSVEVEMQRVELLAKEIKKIIHHYKMVGSKYPLHDHIAFTMMSDCGVIFKSEALEYVEVCCCCGSARDCPYCLGKGLILKGDK